MAALDSCYCMYKASLVKRQEQHLKRGVINQLENRTAGCVPRYNGLAGDLLEGMKRKRVNTETYLSRLRSVVCCIRFLLLVRTTNSGIQCPLFKKAKIVV